MNAREVSVFLVDQYVSISSLEILTLQLSIVDFAPCKVARLQQRI